MEKDFNKSNQTDDIYLFNNEGINDVKHDATSESRPAVATQRTQSSASIADDKQD